MKQLITINNQTAVAALLAAVFTIATSTAKAAVDRVGNPFTPAGANFTIIGLQDVDSSPLGTTTGAQVNQNFEFVGSTGVTFSVGSKITDFGIGLYEDASKQAQSTGLEILFNQPILASSASVTVEDFDIDTGDPFFKDKKVSPSIALLGPGNSIIATALPADIFPNLVPTSVPNGAPGDTWNINFAGLLNTIHLADTPINGFVLFADHTGTEQVSSDPYLLISVGSGTAVPEPSTYLLVVVAGALALLFHTNRRFLKRKAAVS